MVLRSYAWSALLVTAVALVTACGPGAPAPAASVSVSPPASDADAGRKVMVIVEENHGYDQIIGDPDAPYFNRLAATYGTATRYDAGYPEHCPSLAAYILMTSGTTAGICDDRDPKAHRLTGDNLFHQVARSGRQWRDYAEKSPGNCVLTSRGRYLVRHVPPTYYSDDRADCGRWTIPLGSAAAGALHDDVAAGRLPAFSFVSPDACHDMHGAAACPADLVGAGDHWLQNWLPRIMSGPDYRAGRLTVVVTFDEGTSTSNHIPTLVIAPTVHHVSAAQPLTHCSTLRFAEEQLRLPLLGCAAAAPSLGRPFGL
jgi:phosphatidylinositol-3-phosphatase